MPATAPRNEMRRMPLSKITAVARASIHADAHELWDTPVDRSRYFVCPTTTPLYYAKIYHQLASHHQIRYNQLTAILFSELISYFESQFAASVCAAIAKTKGVDAGLTECLNRFVADEQDHIELWRRLSRLSEPDWYSESGWMLFRVTPPVAATLQLLTRRPQWFPMVYWIMLALEERSLDLSRRCMKMETEQIEPHYLWVYREHLKDEMRHVQIDWHLIDLYYSNKSSTLRRCNARLLQTAIGRFLLPPTRSAVRVVQRLAEEFPELNELLPEMKRQLRSLAENAAYQQMMYSRETTPITFGLFDRFPEMHRMQTTLLSYCPVRS